jgi:hypothetical protein
MRACGTRKAEVEGSRESEREMAGRQQLGMDRLDVSTTWRHAGQRRVMALESIGIPAQVDEPRGQ